MLGKRSAASKAKDNQLLAGLGGMVSSTGGSKMVKEVVNTGKFKGKPMGSLLTNEQKAVVAKVGMMYDAHPELNAIYLRTCIFCIFGCCLSCTR